MRHLPHWRQDGATYFVTFRLADSLPQSKLRELKQIQVDWERRHPPPRSVEQEDQIAREIRERVERWLDQGMGSSRLKESGVADTIVESLLHFQDARYDLGSFVIMPNHVHLIVRPLDAARHDLEDILQGWKGFTARRIGVLEDGRLWQEESYDHIIRDEAGLYRVVQYIGRNPRLARLNANEYRLWIRPEWEQIGWGFDDL